MNTMRRNPMGGGKRQMNKRGGRRGGGGFGGLNNNGNKLPPRQNVVQAKQRYLAMAKDAQMQGDRVLAEYYLQHADHYHRILNMYDPHTQQGHGGGERRPQSGGWDGEPDFGHDDQGTEEGTEGAEGQGDAPRQARSHRGAYPSPQPQGRAPRGGDGFDGYGEDAPQEGGSAPHMAPMRQQRRPQPYPREDRGGERERDHRRDGREGRERRPIREPREPMRDENRDNAPGQAGESIDAPFLRAPIPTRRAAPDED